ncbi:MAG: UvrD-helicase domain-containing protein, partial [Gammaproteobacteria bacterium]
MEHITFISAGAGSGKTYRLTEILSERLATRRVRPEAVIATTFTRKAAAGLTQRVRQRLIRDGHYVYANSIGQAYIGTVNSVCGQLLARYAFEAGLSPHLEVLGEQDDTVVFAQALDDAMSSEDIGRLNAIAQRLEIDGWRATVQAIVALARANDMPPEMLPAQAERSLEELFAYFPDPIESDLDDALRDAVAQAIADISTNDDETKGTKTYLDLLHNSAHRIHQGRLTWSDWVRLAGRKPTRRSAPFAEPVAEAASRYDRHPGLHGDIRDWTRALFDLAARAMNTYRMLKAERGVMDFVDQEHELLALLDNPDVASSIREELDLLLVDEFQDTSPIQLAVFIKLAALAKECIWVGDIKQAIYGFRGS